MVFRIIRNLIRALRIWYHGSTRDGSTNKNDAKPVNALPATCLRGLRLASWVEQGRYVATAAFIPNEKTAALRQDGGLETSVNWEDNSNVEAYTLGNHSNAQHGAARITTAHIEHTSLSAVGMNRPLLCERKPEPDNQYHGNIVYSASISKLVKKRLAATLALKSQFVPPPR